MKERFIKFIPSEEAYWLMFNKPNAFRLLTIIADRARRKDGHPDGLKPGQCYLGDWKNYGLTEQKYRTAKSILVMRGHIKIIETCRTRQKSTTGSTTIGTLVTIISSNVYDINKNIDNDRINDRATTEQRQTRRNKKEKEQQQDVAVVSFELEKIPHMTDDLKQELSEKYSGVEISNAVAITLQANPDNHVGFLIHALRKNLEPQEKISPSARSKIQEFLEGQGILDFSLKKDSLKFSDGVIISLSHNPKTLTKLIKDYVKKRTAGIS